MSTNGGFVVSSADILNMMSVDYDYDYRDDRLSANNNSTEGLIDNLLEFQPISHEVSRIKSGNSTEVDDEDEDEVIISKLKKFNFKNKVSFA